MSETILFPLSIEPQELVYQDRNQTIHKVADTRYLFEYPFSDHRYADSPDRLVEASTAIAVEYCRIQLCRKSS